jgi:hypothetical protein
MLRIRDRVISWLTCTSITNLRCRCNKDRDQYYHTGNLAIRVAIEQYVPAVSCGKVGKGKFELILGFSLL